MRWDTEQQLWQEVRASVPQLTIVGNHDIESYYVNATLTPTTFDFE